MPPKNVQVGLSVVASSVVLVGGLVSFMGEGDVEESVVLEHSGADSAGEFFNLLFDVGEESVGAPSSNEHDGVDWLFGEEHHHGEGGSY